jgi:hypothetical protein
VRRVDAPAKVFDKWAARVTARRAGREPVSKEPTSVAFRKPVLGDAGNVPLMEFSSYKIR